MTTGEPQHPGLASPVHTRGPPLSPGTVTVMGLTPGRPFGLLATVLSGCLAVAGCTGPGSGTTTSPDGPARPTQVTSGPPRPQTTQPLVLAVHATTTPVPRISEATARRLVDGRVRTWRPLDRTDRPLRVVRTGSAGRARRTVRDRRTLVVVPGDELTPFLRPVVVGGIDPVRRPRRYPIRTSGPRPGPVTTLRVVGDVMLGRRVADRAAADDDPVAPLRPVQELLTGADLTVANLESTLSTAGPARQGGDSFAALPAAARGLVDVGVDAVSLANNHTGDFGERALLETLGVLADAGLPAFGAGRDLAAASRAVVLERHGVRFGLLGFNAIGETPRATAGTAGALSVRMPPRTGPLVEADLRHVLRQVRRLARRVDVVVVLPHWGTQYTHVAEPVQGRVAARLAGAGADLVVGGHPHWVQGLERHGDTLVAHSLGNFVFDMDFMQQTQEGVALTATFWGDRLVGAGLTPYRLGPDFAPRLARGPSGRAIVADVWRHSTGPFRPPG